MALSNDIASLFAKTVKTEPQTNTETTLIGTAIVGTGKLAVKIDGSDQITPVTTTTAVSDGDRVTVLIKNHSAIVTGNMTSPSANQGDLDDIQNRVDEFGTIIADVVTTGDLEAVNATIDNLVADNVYIKDKLTATEADIGNLEADNVTINGTLVAQQAEIDELAVNKLDVAVADIKYATIDNLEATNADIHNLEADYGDFKILTAENFSAVNADIDQLEAKTAVIDELDTKYANIDFANIGSAAIENFFAKSGMIGDLVVGDGTITGTLVGVTIKGDLIEGGTVVADKLVVKGEDGLYYKLNTDGVTTEAEQTDYNSLNGSIITAKSITATKISVDDLVAFDATIGGFTITENSLYSGVKASSDNTTRGIFLGDDGQLAVGDETNYLKYFKDTDGTYKLAISASALYLGSSDANLGDKIDEVLNAADNISGFETRLSNAETSIQQNSEEIQLRATKNEVSTIADNANEAINRVTANEASLTILSDSIATLVTDGEGQSVMEQTPDGWRFNIGEIQNSISKAITKVTDVEGDLGVTKQIVADTNGLVNSILTKTAYINMTVDENGDPCIELGRSDSLFKLRITNTSVDFMQGDIKVAYINNQSLYIERAVVKDELKIGESPGFVWRTRTNGNMGLRLEV